MITKEDVVDLMQELELPDVFLTLYDGIKLPVPIDFSIGVPEAFFSMSEEEQLRYGNGQLYPLWDDGEMGLLVAYDKKRGGFVRFYLGQEEPETLPLLTYQQIMVEEFAGFWEDLLGEFNDEVEQCVKPFQKFAKLFDFERVEELLEELLTGVDYTDEEWLQTFINDLAK